VHESQTINTDVRGVCLSVCPSISLSVTWSHSVQPLPNHFGIFESDISGHIIVK